MAIVRNTEESREHRGYALDMVLFFIEDIDNGNDLMKMDVEGMGALGTLGIGMGSQIF